MPAKETEAPAAAEPAAPAGPSKAPLILALLNTLLVLGGAGMLYYAKFMFHRPAITEESERKRLEATQAQPEAPRAPGNVVFDPITVNIEPYAARPGDTEGKLHYVTLGFAVELRDLAQKDALDAVRPILMDKILAMLAHKPFHELSTVQGRYVLRTQILDLVNGLTANLPSHPPAPSAPKAETGEHGGGGGEHGGGEHGGGEEHGGTKPKEAPKADGPPMREIFRDGLASNVFFTQFIVQ